MNIFVGNLSQETTENDLRHAFEVFGQVAFANIIKDRATRKSRGFGFVEMPNEAEASAAIGGLNRKELNGQQIIVSKARPRSKSHQGGGTPHKGYQGNVSLTDKQQR